MFLSKNFQLVYPQSHLWVGLETAGDLCLCFCNVSSLSFCFHVHITWPLPNLGKYCSIWQMRKLMSYVRFPYFSSHAFSIALSHIWHLVLVFITPTWKWFFMTSYYFCYSILGENHSRICGVLERTTPLCRLPSPHSPLPPLPSAVIQFLYDINTSTSFLCIFPKPWILEIDWAINSSEWGYTLFHILLGSEDDVRVERCFPYHYGL